MQQRKRRVIHESRAPLNSLFSGLPGRGNGAKIERLHASKSFGRWFALILIVGIATLAFLAVRGVFRTFDAQAIAVSIEGPEKVSSASAVTYLLRIRNTESLPLSDVTVFAQFPKSFSLGRVSLEPTVRGRNTWRIENLQPDETRTIQYSGTLYGDPESSERFIFDIRITPKGYSLSYERRAEFVTTITDSPVRIELRVPEAVAIGKETELGIRFHNVNAADFPKATAYVEAPDVFEVTRTVPISSSLASPVRLEIPTLAPQQEYRATVVGVVRTSTLGDVPLAVRVILKDDRTGLTITEASAPLNVQLDPVSIFVQLDRRQFDVPAPAIIKANVFVQEHEGIRDARLALTVDDATGQLDRVDVDLPGDRVVRTDVRELPLRITIDAQEFSPLSALDAGQSVAFTVVLYPKPEASSGEVRIKLEAIGVSRKDASLFSIVSEPVAITFRASVGGKIQISDIGNGNAQALVELTNNGERIEDVRVTIRLPRGASLEQTVDVQAGSVGVQSGSVVWVLPWVPSGVNNRAASVSSKLTFSRGSLTSEEFVRMIGLIDVAWKTKDGESRTVRFFPLLKS